MSSAYHILTGFPSWLLILSGIALVLAVWFLSTLALRSQLKKGLTLSEAKDEMEIRKAFFTIVGMVSIVITIAFAASEVSVAVRAENREQLYAALGQLAESSAKSPEVSSAALLQLGKLGAASPDDLPALVRVVNAYLTANAKDPVAEHEGNDVTRPDIEVAILVLSNLVKEQPDLGSLVRLKGLDLRYLRGNNLFLPKARLIEVNLGGATLRGANFSHSEFVDVTIETGNFSEVNVSGAKLKNFTIAGTPHSETNFCASFVDGRRILVDDVVQFTTKECSND